MSMCSWYTACAAGTKTLTPVMSARQSSDVVGRCWVGVSAQGAQGAPQGVRCRLRAGAWDAGAHLGAGGRQRLRCAALPRPAPRAAWRPPADVAARSMLVSASKQMASWQGLVQSSCWLYNHLEKAKHCQITQARVKPGPLCQQGKLACLAGGVDLGLPVDDGEDALRGRLALGHICSKKRTSYQWLQAKQSGRLRAAWVERECSAGGMPQANANQGQALQAPVAGGRLVPGKNIWACAAPMAARKMEKKTCRGGGPTVCAWVGGK